MFPDMLTSFLRFSFQGIQINPRYPPILHAHRPIYDHRINVITEPALNQALDRIADGTISKRISSTQVYDDNIGPGTLS